MESKRSMCQLGRILSGIAYLSRRTKLGHFKPNNASKTGEDALMINALIALRSLRLCWIHCTQGCDLYLVSISNYVLVSTILLIFQTIWTVQWTNLHIWMNISITVSVCNYARRCMLTSNPIIVSFISVARNWKGWSQAKRLGGTPSWTSHWAPASRTEA